MSAIFVALSFFLEGILLSAEVVLALFANTPAFKLEPAIHHFALENAKSEGIIHPPTPALPRLRVRNPEESKPMESLGIDTNHLWNEPLSCDTMVRSLSYMKDGMKIRAGENLGKLLHVDLWSATQVMDGRQDHVAQLDHARKDSILKYFEIEYPKDTIFITNIQLPGTPFVHVVCYWWLKAEILKAEDAANFLTLWDKFCKIDQDDCAFQNERFKLIPTIVDGPWLIRATVPQKPAITGTKLTQRYFRGSNYMEVDMDIASSTIAANIVSVCRG
ncbi:hypothetical protein THRCLA_08453 [Thraustotheca clavata]|uniref:Protein ENHANCED DISEASE RESISTANCE 2 C-terminal domain-containing protein n=1 Tax=Thraustotheca clavata TaxID=74557 RepID=A0A1V9Z627_9STRA|nr:hypothetical protein THRCLA_08453 [Thraustotheca clavata]